MIDDEGMMLVLISQNCIPTMPDFIPILNCLESENNLRIQSPPSLEITISKVLKSFFYKSLLSLFMVRPWNST